MYTLVPNGLESWFMYSAMSDGAETLSLPMIVEGVMPSPMPRISQA